MNKTSQPANPVNPLPGGTIPNPPAKFAKLGHSRNRKRYLGKDSHLVYRCVSVNFGGSKELRRIDRLPTVKTKCGRSFRVDVAGLIHSRRLKDLPHEKKIPPQPPREIEILRAMEFFKKAIDEKAIIRIHDLSTYQAKHGFNRIWGYVSNGSAIVAAYRCGLSLKFEGNLNPALPISRKWFAKQEELNRQYEKPSGYYRGEIIPFPKGMKILLDDLSRRFGVMSLDERHANRLKRIERFKKYLPGRVADERATA